MSECTAREKLLWKWWIFSGEKAQHHGWKSRLSWEGLWWDISYDCEHCGISEREWGLRDAKMMERLDLKVCPPSGYYNHYYDEDLDKYREFPKASEE